jgi:hypothetical protein
MIRNLIFVAIFFLACNNPGTINNTPVVTTKNHPEPHTGLILNNGAKWQSDETTRVHIAKLNAVIAAFNKKSNPGMDEYQTLALETQKELNALVRDCKMKGPDHDALHKWLEPVLESVKELKRARSVDRAAVIAQNLINRIQEFNQYFN